MISGMTLRRTLDPTLLNQVANHPEVRPWLGGEGDLDLSALVRDVGNIALICDTGGFVLTKHEPGVYEVHSQFLPHTRHVADMAREGFAYMFAATDCIEVVTRVPVSNARAGALAKTVGFSEKFARPLAWAGPDGALGDVSYQALTLEAWVARADGLLELGHWFHDRLEAQKTAAGSTLQPHPDDEAHERAVGAAVQMFRAGNARKAVWAYNRWARLAGYQPLELLSEAPVIVDVRDAVIELHGDEFEVLLCR